LLLLASYTRSVPHGPQSPRPRQGRQLGEERDASSLIPPSQSGPVIQCCGAIMLPRQLTTQRSATKRSEIAHLLRISHVRVARQERDAALGDVDPAPFARRAWARLGSDDRQVGSDSPGASRAWGE